MFLHAKSLTFKCPITKKNIKINAEYDTAMQLFIKKMEKSSNDK
jgi:hypothetical protein